MNQRSYQRLIPLLLPLVLAACEEQESQEAAPAPETPSTAPGPAEPGTPTPPSTPAPGQ
jgi:hypothetical protein